MVANTASYVISSSMILVIHENIINGTNYIVLHVLADIFWESCRHYSIISFPYNEIRVQYKIFTSETTRYTNLVQAPWAKRQVEILRSGS
jgi:hypothetical protein